VGRVMLLRVAAATDQLMALLLTRLATPGGKWG
jgi:hypothetical protein